MIVLIILMFWNVENFFAPGAMEGKSWSSSRFYAKCSAISKTVLLAGDEFGDYPDIVAFAEIGERQVLTRMLAGTPLRKLDYRIVHYESPDHRGIDCALIYRRSRLTLINSKPIHLYNEDGSVMSTRDILLAVFSEADGDTLAVLVNHHPSKLGDDSGKRREMAMQRLEFVCDSLKADGIKRIAAVGDFNDTVISSPNVSAAYGNKGSIKFNGKWEKIDGCPILEGMTATEYIFDAPHLSTKDAGYSGQKPLRTFSGPRYLGGVSDHYPIVLKTSGDPEEPPLSH